MVRRNLFRRTVWLLVGATLGPGCGDGESVETPRRSVGDCGPQSGTNPSLATLCGNGVVDPACGGEECDDGNLRAYDACLPNCEFARCGDGILRTVYPEGCDAPNDDESCPRFEACDDGNDEDGDGCSAACLVEE